jgi:prephenate dehydrogenase
MIPLPRTVSIVGFGAFGKLLTHIILTHSNATVHVVSSKKIKSISHRLRQIQMQDIAEADLVIPCIPISAFEKTIQKIAPFLKHEAIVMDICSVKIQPVQHMKKHLPKNVQIIATHPMFGPDSFRINKGLKNVRMMIHNVSARSSEFHTICSFFAQLGVEMIPMTPRQHDKYMAWSLGYSYLIGKIGQRIKIKKTPIDTFDFELLLQNKGIVQNDSEELFLDMQTYNPYASVVQKKVTATLSAILKTIDQKRKNML